MGSNLEIPNTRPVLKPLEHQCGQSLEDLISLSKAFRKSPHY